MPELEIFLLGSPRIERDGAPARVDTRKAIALAAYLAVADGSHRRDTLALLLWPEADETHARAALRRTLSSLNRALEGHGLSIDRETVGLSQRHPLSVDAIRFRSLIDLRLGHDHPVSEVCEACIEPSEEAVAIYKGDFLSGFSLRDSPEFDDWQLSQAERMRRDLASVLETLVRGHGATGNFERAIDHARSWVALDPLAERSHRELMKVYGWLGQRAAAQRQYRDCVRIMDRELGVSPLEETTELYRAIMEDRGPPKPAFAAESKGSDPGAPEAPARTAAPAPERSSSYPLVGRKKEWEILLRDYQAVGNEGRLVVLQGESGIGKTRLAEDFLEHVRARGGVTLAAKCYEGESTLAYSPFVSAFSSLLASESGGLISKVDSNWLSEASRLLPQLRDLKSEVAPPTPLDTPGARIRFFEAVGQIMQDTLAGAVPGVLFIDDLQWADDASIELLSYLVRRLRSRSILVLLAIRPDVVASRSLQILLADAQRSDVATIVEIGRLDLPSTVELARAVTGDARGLPEGFEEWLYRETEGLPFFLVEYLPAALSGSEDEGFDWEMPMRVRSLLLSRVSALSETGRQLLDTAAVIGRRFGFDTVHEASGRDEDEAVAAVEELSGAGLVKEVDGGDAPLYDFAYDQLRRLVAENVSIARRRLLHRRVADTLASHSEARRGGESTSAAIARHYQMAGKDSEAAEYFMLAGSESRSLYANVEALSHLRSALELGHPAAASLQEAIGDIHTLLGEYGAALGSYEASASVAETADLGRIERKIGSVHHRRGDWTLAESHFASADRLLERDDRAGERARLYADWSVASLRRGGAGRGRELAQVAAELAEASGDTGSVAQAHNIMGLLARNERDFPSAYRHLSLSLELADVADNRTVRIAALNNLALAHRATITGSSRSRETATGRRRSTTICDLYHDAGRADEAMSQLGGDLLRDRHAGAPRAGCWSRVDRDRTPPRESVEA